jgi:hypothetical protein
MDQKGNVPITLKKPTRQVPASPKAKDSSNSPEGVLLMSMGAVCLLSYRTH